MSASIPLSPAAQEIFDRAVERQASADLHAGLIVGALSVHGADFEWPTSDRPGRTTILGRTRNGHPIEITVEVHPDAV